MTKVKTLFVSLVAILALANQIAGEVEYQCNDVLTKDSQLCKRWKAKGGCAKRSVRDFCQRSCNMCSDDDNDEFSVQYLGCFNDGIASELKLVSTRSQVTVRSCINSCRKLEFSYAGLRNGMYCMCGNDYGQHGENLKRDGCSKTCGSREACGGLLENAMYKTDKDKRVINREYLDNIEALIFGKDKTQAVSTKKSKKVTIAMPKRRDWDFMDWIRHYEEDQKN